MGNNKIKVVGQPMYNIGDLAACKSLTLLLKNKYDSPLEYSIFENRTIDDEFKKIDGAKFEKNITVSNKYIKMFTILSPKSIRIISLFFPKTKKKYKSLLDSDLVLFAPGGLELGLYKEWDYLWIMSVLVAFKKDFGLYSRSIGDFQNKTILDLIFKKQAIKYLKLSKFNGLRDQRSQKEARSLGIPFFPSIDVVFSSVPDYNKFDQGELTAKFGSNYMVFTPSTFEWHTKFSAYPSTAFVDLYLKIVNTTLEKTDLNIVMLPHIYKDDSDAQYFNSIKERCSKPDRVFVVENNADSDLYQFIISKAKCAILSRLHQTIFSVNNHTPFLCISYEHKMEDMMKILNLQDYTVKLNDILDGKIEIPLMLDRALFEPVDKKRLVEAQKKANQIALRSFEKFTQIISDIK